MDSNDKINEIKDIIRNDLFVEDFNYFAIIFEKGYRLDLHVDYDVIFSLIDFETEIKHSENNKLIHTSIFTIPDYLSN